RTSTSRSASWSWSRADARQRRPLLTTRLTLAPPRNRLPGWGFCERTRPFLIVLEAPCVILPTVQLCGHDALREKGEGGGECLLADARVDLADVGSRAVSPDQPWNREPAEAVALSVMRVPESSKTEQVDPQLSPA